MPPKSMQLFRSNPHRDVEHEGGTQRGIAKYRKPTTPIAQLILRFF
ncbi:hypothetical protein H7849_07900 [Alloacidobacterium dinghuense]|uniref:Uncharacterized protein n=1 Tax=Alloacidobacterium dinghuense TaxID=2763107 RepID=A0A7G8BMQ7_9BACT|nr:hypothetical protein [Alloacidobacterium dinghuense]QNI33827.1 hypothetical protein H7849_07900 [Alloacidobacterium dinghuense]